MSDKSEGLQRNKPYPVVDWGCIKGIHGDPQHYRALWTGEKRAPRKGEFYLSGAIIEAYFAFNDMQTPCHIAKIVMVEVITKTEVRIVKEL